MTGTAEERARNFKRNLALLRLRFPEVARGVSSATVGRACELVPARNGHLSLLVKRSGKSICYHSRFDPQKEAAFFIEKSDVADADLVFCLGLGLGYHIRYLLRFLRQKKAALFLFESDDEILRAFLEIHDWSALLRHPRVYLFGRECNATRLLPWLSLYLRPQYYANRNWRFLLWAAAKKLAPAYYEQVRRSVKEAVDHVVLNTNTDRLMGPLWPENSWKNLRQITRSAPAKNLFGAFKLIPWIVVSTGPSLDEALDDLKALQTRAVICAAGSAYRVLLSHGITPHFVVAVDAKEINFLHFAGIGSPETFLVYDPMLTPSILDRNIERLFICQIGSDERNPPIRLIKQIFGDMGMIPSAYSVATTCFSLGFLAGADPIIFVGQDLCYHNGRSHARESALCHELIKNVEPLSDYRIKTNDGREALTNRGWVAMLRVLEAMIENSGRTCYTTALHGASIKGAPYKSMKACRQMLTEKPFLWQTIEKCWKPFGHDKGRLQQLAENLRRAIRDIERLREEAHEYKSLTEKLLLHHLGGNANQVEALAQMVQKKIEWLKKDQRLFWVRPWMHEIVNYLQKSQTRREQHVDARAWEINRAGIYFEGIEKSSAQALKPMKKANQDFFGFAS